MKQGKDLVCERAMVEPLAIENRQIPGGGGCKKKEIRRLPDLLEPIDDLFELGVVDQALELRLREPLLGCPGSLELVVPLLFEIPGIVEAGPTGPGLLEEGDQVFRDLIGQLLVAITGEKALPTLDAAHIRGVAEGGRHELPNGLLRSVILRHPAVLLTRAFPYV